MELLFAPVPFFDKYMSVEAYLLRYYLHGQQDSPPAGERTSPLLQALENGSIEAYGGGNLLFIPVGTEILSWGLENIHPSSEKVVFLLGSYPGRLEPQQIDALQRLRDLGYKFAATQSGHFLDDDKLLKLATYVLFGGEAMSGSDRRAHVIRYKNMHKHLQLIATEIETQAEYDSALKDGFHLFEGMFYRIPVTRKDRELTPIKANLIRLLNLVRDESFEFRDVADIVRQDPALTYSLMRFINSPFLGIRYKVKSIQQAVTILGQIEVRKWVTAAVFKALGSDRPSELTRISLVRAKYAENLAGLFGFGEESPSLFLMGLFSVLDSMLDTDMENALSRVLVTDEIADALIHDSGPFQPVKQFVTDYERADWDKVLQNCGQSRLAIRDVHTAYYNAVDWYYELINEKVRLRNRPGNSGTPFRERSS